MSIFSVVAMVTLVYSICISIFSVVAMVTVVYSSGCASWHDYNKGSTF